MSEDLYGVLGLDRNASDADIKKAYRTQARKYHPDVNKEAGAEDKFKQIQRAYTVLSDSQRKAQYDQFGVADDSAAGGGGPGFSGFEGFSDSFEDIFESFFGGSGSRSSRRSGPTQGDDLRYDMEISLEEAATGCDKDITIFHMGACSRCEGSGAQPDTSKTTCSQCKGSGQIKTVQRTMLGTFSQVTTCRSCSGTGQIIEHPCLVCQGQGLEKKKKSINVEIPKGVDKGMKLRVVNEGNQGEHGGPPGDLYVFITVTDHEYFRREGDDIYLEVEVPLSQAVLGTKIEVPVIGGQAYIKIPEGTQSGTAFRLKGKGMSRVRGFGMGDQYVTVNVNIPKNISKKEKQLIEEFGSIRKENTSEKAVVKRLY